MTMRMLLAGLFALVLALPARSEIDITPVQSPGGIDAWLVEDHNIPFVALELRFRGGGSLDAPDKRGATNLMVGLLEEGAGDMDARGFAEAVEGLAASFRFDVGDDAVSVSARFLSDTTQEATTLLRAALVAPRFDPGAVERVRAQVISGLKRDEKDPDAIASRTFDALAFRDHPYATSYQGTLDSVAALTRADLVTAHQGALARDRVYVAAVGDITAAELGELIDTLLGDLPGSGAPMPGPAALYLDGGTTVVPFDTPQSVALFGQEGLPLDHPDFFPAFVLNTALGGGGFESRLMDEVREKRGLTYGIGSYLVTKDHAALYVGRVASANDRMAQAIQVIRDVWADTARNGLTEAELEQAKTYLTGAYPLRFDGNATIANILVGMQMDDMPIDYAATRNDRVRAVTLQDVNRVARELLHPEALHFVVVGQPAGL